MPVIKATNETYHQLIAQPGLTLVMYDIARERYGNDRRIRAAFRRLARERGDRFRFVLVDMSEIPISSKQISFVPTFCMYLDGQCIGEEEGRRHPNVSSDAGFVQWAEGFLPEEDRAVLARIVYPLPHGIELTVERIREPIELAYVADFLIDAMRHFKRHRDQLKTGLYTEGAYRGTARRRRCPRLCDFRLSHAGDKEGHYLTAAQWTEAVISAYTSADTLKQIAEDIERFRADARTDPTGWVMDVIQALGQPYGHLKALRKMFEQAEKWDAESPSVSAPQCPDTSAGAAS
jgi:hypothetical protein